MIGDDVMPGRFSSTGQVNVRQSSLLHLERQDNSPIRTAPYFAKVVKVHTDRGTVDITTPVEANFNVPIMCKVGIDASSKLWGEIEYPAIDDYVLVLPLDKFNQKKIVIGSMYPFLSHAFNDQQVPVNSVNKVFTLKLLELGLEKVYRKIFPSGTSVEVKADGSVIVETPSGTNVLLDESAKKIILQQKDGSSLCTFSIAAGGGFALKDKDNNEVVSSSLGMQLKDKNGNVINMTTGKVVINSNFEVDQ